MVSGRSSCVCERQQHQMGECVSDSSSRGAVAEGWVRGMTPAYPATLHDELQRVAALLPAGVEYCAVIQCTGVLHSNVVALLGACCCCDVPEPAVGKLEQRLQSMEWIRARVDLLR
jgi:hypothetical protein